MKTRIKTSRSTWFSAMRQGDMFIVPDTMAAYIRTSVTFDNDGNQYNSVVLGTGQMAWIDESIAVIPAKDAELIVEVG